MDILDPRLFNLLPEHQTSQANNLWNCALFLTQLANISEQQQQQQQQQPGSSGSMSSHSYSAPQLHRMIDHHSSTAAPAPTPTPQQPHPHHQPHSNVHLPHHFHHHPMAHHPETFLNLNAAHALPNPTEHCLHILDANNEYCSLSLSTNLDEIFTRLLKIKRRNKVSNKYYLRVEKKVKQIKRSLF